jgi:glyoxylase-like metal-dependent hydrolase (beta-lactamase superfamily II)
MEAPMSRSLARSRVASTVALLAALSAPAAAQQPAARAAAAPPVGTGAIANRGQTLADYPKMQRLADGVYAYSGVHTRGFTTNSLIVVTNEGVLVADGQGSVQDVQKMLEMIRTVTEQPVRWVVMGSDHGDHTGGNSAFPENVTFFAHPTSAAIFRTQAANPGRAGARPVRVPSELVADRRALNLGGRQIEIIFDGRAHTGGDLEVWLPQEKILFTSEIFFHRIFPSMRTALPSEWIDVLRKVEARDASVFVPGHGFVDSPQVLETELTEYRQATEAVVAEARRLHALKISAADALAQANWGQYASWTGVEQNAPIALQRVWDEMDGKLPARP